MAQNLRGLSGTSSLNEGQILHPSESHSLARLGHVGHLGQWSTSGPLPVTSRMGSSAWPPGLSRQLPDALPGVRGWPTALHQERGLPFPLREPGSPDTAMCLCQAAWGDLWEHPRRNRM